MLNRLQEILGNVKRSDFLGQYYEQKCLLIQRNTAEFVGFTLDSFERLLSLPGVRPLLRIVKEQQEDQSPAAVAENGHLSKPYLLAKVSQGYTLVLNDIHRLDSSLQELAAQLGWELGCYCAINAYLTPARTQALKPHFDSHDIFAIQCHGSKRWHVQTEGTKLPTLSTHQPVLEDIDANGLTAIDLRKGDVMYVPRGSIHYAVANNEHSLHLTIGLYPIEWKDLLGAVVEELADQHLILRRSVPLGERRSSDLRSVDAVLKLMGSNLPDDLVLRSMDRLERDLLVRQPQALGGSLESVMNVSLLKDASTKDLWLQRSLQPIRVSAQAGGSRVELAGVGFTIPLAAPELILKLVETEAPFLLSEKLEQPFNPIVQVIAETLIQRGVLRLINQEERH